MALIRSSAEAANEPGGLGLGYRGVRARLRGDRLGVTHASNGMVRFETGQRPTLADPERCVERFLWASGTRQLSTRVPQPTEAHRPSEPDGKEPSP